MPKRLAVVGLIVLALVMAIALAFWLKRMWHDWITSRAPHRETSPALPATLRQDEEPAAQPNISLQVNGQDELMVLQGTPLIFSMRLSNQRATNAAAWNYTSEKQLGTLQAAVARGEMAKEKAEARVARLRKKRAVHLVRLGEESAGWQQFVRFSVLLPDGKRQPLAWPVELVTPPQTSVTLDEKNAAQLDYTMGPKSTAGIAAGEYQVVAALEVPAEANLPADRWRGRVESEPVSLRIAQKPARLSELDQEQLLLAFARYFSLAGKLREALESAQQAVAVNPKSISAHILVGEAKERLGDPAGALAAFETAQAEYSRQYPRSYEAPLYLIHKNTELMRKLSLIPRQAEAKSAGH